MRAFALRPVQVAALDGVAQHWRRADGGDRRALVILPTGVGKTIMALEAVRRAVERGVRCLWVAHREELVTQPLATVEAVEHFHAVAAVAGVVKGNRNDHDAQVVFTSVQTMRHRGEHYLSHGLPGLVVVDEAHHYAPGSSWYDTVLGLIGADVETGVGGCHVLGLTATPQRGDNVALGAMWGRHPAYCYSVSEAMRDGYLLRPEFQFHPLEMSEELQDAMDVCNSDGASDVSKATAKALLDEGVAEHTAEVVVDVVGGESGHVLVYCASVAQVEATADALRSMCSMVVGTVTGTTPAAERRELLQSFMRGETHVLVNCDVLTEGTDLPIADTIVLARPCGSKALYVQIVGRGARLYPGQSSFRVIDILGATQVHTLEQAPVIDVGLSKVDKRKVSESDMSLVCPMDVETEHIVAPAKSLWTADIIFEDEPDEYDRWQGTARLRGPYRTQIGGRPLGSLVELPPGEEPPEMIVQVGHKAQAGCNTPGIWFAYHQVRVARPVALEDWSVAWVALYDDCKGVDIGRDGTCYLVQHHEDAERWWPVRIPHWGRSAAALSSSAVSIDIANLIVRDVVRRAGDNDRAVLIQGDAEWRLRPVTDGQRRLMAKHQIDETVTTRGDATVAITRAILLEKVDHHNLRRGWQP